MPARVGATVPAGARGRRQVQNPAAVSRGVGCLAALLLLLVCACTALGTAIACPSGWTLFSDDGVEGHDSCIKAVTSATTFSSATSACSSLSAGAHLVTFLNTQPTGLPEAASTLGTSSPFWVGCSQSSTASLRGVGWMWVDGTDGGNINCGTGLGGDGCNLWDSGYPKSVTVKFCAVISLLQCQHCGICLAKGRC